MFVCCQLAGHSGFADPCVAVQFPRHLDWLSSTIIATLQGKQGSNPANTSTPCTAQAQNVQILPRNGESDKVEKAIVLSGVEHVASTSHTFN